MDLLMNWILSVLEFPWIIYMGHLLSKNGYRLKKRTRKLHHRKKKKRNCFLQLPCMLCFIVHSNSSGLDDEGDHLEAGINGSACRHNSITGISVPGVGGVGIGAAAASKLAERYATLTSPEDCSKFLLSPRELAIWEGQGRSLLSAVPAKLIPPPALFRSAGVSVNVPLPVPGSTSDYTEMVGSCTNSTTCCSCWRCSIDPNQFRGPKQPWFTSTADSNSKVLLSYAKSYSVEMAMKFFWPELPQQCNIYNEMQKFKIQNKK